MELNESKDACRERRECEMMRREDDTVNDRS